MNKGEILDDAGLDKLVDKHDSLFRISFEKNILNTKLLTHKCQYLCYNSNTSILKAEECARNCYKPMMMIKKNVTRLYENAKEKFEKCKFDKKMLSNTSATLYNMQVKNCLSEYSKNMEESKEEIEFIYEGYTKNFEKLIPENKDNQI